jgi:predicted RNA-binding Zn ribbon-like protein
LARPARSDRNPELGRRPVRLGRGKHLQGGAAARQARGKPPAATDLEALNDLLAASPTRTTLKRERSGFSWDVDIRGSTALGQLAPVLWTAGDLLTGSKLDKVRRCANPECGWLFLDDSRAGKRRWCSMSACGNRAKARRHYHKSREQ